MTQEEKSLLLQDLCARLPHHCRVFYEYVDDLDNKTYGYSITLNTWCIDELDSNKAVVKPYLRPMSSMTPEEFEEYTKLIKPIVFNKIQVNMASPESFDYLNKKMFDYRGLISKGLALEAPDSMYN